MNSDGFRGTRITNSLQITGGLELNSNQPRLMFKACPRCLDGDVYRDRDAYGEYLDCIQCGWMLDLPRNDRVEEWRRTAAADGLELTTDSAS